MKKTLLLIGLLVSTSLFALPAQASIVTTVLNGGVEMSGGIPDTPFNTVTANFYDTKDKNNVKIVGYGYDGASGSLAANTKIIFTYTVTSGSSDRPNWMMISQGFSGGKVEYGTWQNIGDTGPVKTFEGTLALSNLTATAASFLTYLFSEKVISVASKYRTESLSAVPLPAALPLLGVGLLGLAGYRRIKNKV